MSPDIASVGTIRPAHPADLDALAAIWYDGWRDAHLAIVPDALIRARSRESFLPRLHEAFGDVRVAGPLGAPEGFVMLKHDELYQLYVGAGDRGRGVAQALIADAEEQLAARGHAQAWLACAIGNGRAERFYQKSGWTNAGRMTVRLEIPAGECLLEVWRFERTLSAAAGTPARASA